MRNNSIHVYKQTASIDGAKMNSSEINNNGQYLECPRCSKCWLYKGANPYYATCSFCKYSVNIRKNKIQADKIVSQANCQHEPTRRGDQ